MKKFNIYDIFYDVQHGFQLFRFQADFMTKLKSGKQTNILFMDISKAFDKIGHERLGQKIKHYAIRGNTNKWIQSFLSEWKQTIVL